MKTKSSGLSSVKIINIYGRAISDQKEIANSFNSYFTNFQLPSYCTVEDSKRFVSSTFLSLGHSKKLVPPKNGFSLEHASHSEIIRLIGKLHDSSSAGISCIATRIIKACAEELAPSLVKLFNFCTDNSCQPDEWKFAYVHPLYKGKGEVDDRDN